tara:strand:+ start:19106 stop:19426 length:321 start_codon:yes stop_codon:yes gene_type:complete
MNVLELLATSPTLTELQGLAIVLSAELNTEFNEIQQSLGERQFQAQTVALTDGQYFLGADLLSEINSGGLYQNGFSAISQDLLALTVIIPMNEVRELLPEQTMDIE